LDLSILLNLMSTTFKFCIARMSAPSGNQTTPLGGSPGGVTVSGVEQQLLWLE